MKTTGRYCEVLNVDPELELQNEVDEALGYLNGYTSNIDKLLGSRSKEVKKAMINYLVEQL